MFTIQTLNKISPEGLGRFPRARYKISDEGGGVDGILLRSANLHDFELEDNTLAIARAGAGTNNIPIDRCTERGIVVFNTPGANANAVCELVIFGLLASSRQVIKAVEWAKGLIGQGDAIPKLIEKTKSQFVGPELRGKTLGVVGLGAIGARVTDAAIALGMKVIGYDPFLSVEAAWRLDSHAMMSELLDTLYSDCDYISLHAPLTKETKAMVNAESIAQMKDGARLLNFSRGDLIDDDAVLSALDSGKLSYYVTDFANEKLLKHDKCLCIPHLGASTPEAEDNCAFMAAEQLIDYLEHGNIVNSVNFPRCKLIRNGPYRLCVTALPSPELIATLSSQIHGIMAIKSQSNAALCYTIMDLLQPVDIEEIKAIDGVIRVRLLT
ncbi:MAG: 3-phosphoglycerate dehydrogenase family protein [Bradymonadales bacterium]